MSKVDTEYVGHYFGLFVWIVVSLGIASPVAARATQFASVGDDFIGGLNELHERGVARREGEDVLPHAVVVLEAPVELELLQPAHHGGHGGGIGELADDVRREDTRRKDVQVGLEAQAEEQEQRERSAVGGIYRDDRESYGGELGPGVEVCDGRWGSGRQLRQEVALAEGLVVQMRIDGDHHRWNVGIAVRGENGEDVGGHPRYRGY